MAANSEERLFEIGEESFSVLVDYRVSIGVAWGKALKQVVDYGNVKLENRDFPFSRLGKARFQLCYATLQKNAHLWNMAEEFNKHSIVPADMMQLFAFVCVHAKTEVTAEKHEPIVAADPGSRWLCSHEILHEMAGVKWRFWHHKPGPSLGTTSQTPHHGFEKGTRFLALRTF